jgi:hypothetical protein
MQIGVNNRSRTYCIAHAMQRCGCCARLTPVVAVVLPPGYETLGIDADAEDETAGTDAWETAEAGAFLFFIENLPDAVESRLHGFSQHYHRGHGQGESSCWSNHCSFCGAQQDDFELYCEPEGAFAPISEEAAALIRIYEVSEAFEAQAGGYACAPDLFDHASIGESAEALNLLGHDREE